MPGTHKDRNPRGVEIVFDEPTHRYTSDIGGVETEYVSVTTLVHRFAPPFDALKAAEKVSARTGESVEDVIAKWDSKRDAACEFGTRVHEVCEDCMLGRTPRNAPRSEAERTVFRNAWEAASSIKAESASVFGVEKILFDTQLRLAGTADLIVTDRDGTVRIVDWKGVAIDTPIRTKDGWKTMGDISVGDIVFDKDGNETAVLHTSDVHLNPCYKVKFDNGDEIVADHEHRWLVSFIDGGVKTEVVATTEQIHEHLRLRPRPRKTRDIPKIYNHKPIRSKSASRLPIDPYTLGVWLGDGSSACGVITNPNNGIFEHIHSRGYEIGPDVSGKNGCVTRTIYGLATQLRESGILRNKHIPKCYMESPEDAIELLRGFMDADGYFNKKRSQFSMSTTREFQKDFFCELLSSLGIKFHAFKIHKTGFGKEFDAWDVCFRCDGFNPFRVRNQDIDFKSKKDCSSFRNIDSVEKVDTVPTRCIEVDSPTHTFLVGKTMIVTHNTNERLRDRSDYGETMLFPLDRMDHCELNTYALQLGVYQYIMERNGYVPRGSKFRRTVVHIQADGARIHELPDVGIEVRDAIIQGGLSIPGVLP